MNQRSVNNAHRKIIQWTLPRKALCWQKLSMLLEFLQGCTLCTVCNHSEQRAAICYSVLRLCVMCMCCTNVYTCTYTARTSGRSCTVRILVYWFVHLVFIWLYVFSETNDSNSGPDHSQFKSSKYVELTILKALVKVFCGILPLNPLLNVTMSNYLTCPAG